MSKVDDTVIIVGAGLAGLVAAYELTRKNVHVTFVEQENEKNFGGQAFWSLGGLFLVNSADQRSKGIKDSRELAYRDWLGTARFDREKEDTWPRKWAKAYIDFATDEKERYLKNLGLKFLTVGWAERGASAGGGHGNSVPRFHLTWGIGPELVRIFADPIKAAAKKGLVAFKYRHQVDSLIVDNSTGAAVGVRGSILEPSDADRGVASSRTVVGAFELRGRAVIISTGGVGGNPDLVKKNWPVKRLGKVPEYFVHGVPAHVDGRGVELAERAGANVINMDRMWHYTEGLANWDPIWAAHGIRIIAGPSSLWLDATGKRLPAPLYPGCDTLATLKYIGSTGYDYTWFILNRQIASREFTLSGSEQNPDLASKNYFKLLHRAFTRWGTYPVQAFMKHGADFIVEKDFASLVERMNKLGTERGGPVLEHDKILDEIKTRDEQTQHAYSKDPQIMLIKNARDFASDKIRVPKPGPILDPSSGPLIAIRCNIITRKSLGGLETNLDSNVMRPDGTPFPGLYAAGEAAGFGGGGVHGYSSLEGTFVGGCIFSGRAAGRAIASSISGSGLQARL